MDIAFHSLAARRHGAVAELESIGKELLANDRQLERALGASLLAWHPEGERILKPRIEGDPSLWVRGHANWASQVSHRDQLGRQVYRSALRAESWLEQQAFFEQLVPLVMPTFEIWGYHDEDLMQLVDALEPRRKALLIDARHELRQKIKWDRIRLFGRDLKKFCRGEDLTFRLQAGESGPPWICSSAD